MNILLNFPIKQYGIENTTLRKLIDIIEYRCTIITVAWTTFPYKAYGVKSRGAKLYNCINRCKQRSIKYYAYARI